VCKRTNPKCDVCAVSKLALLFGEDTRSRGEPVITADEERAFYDRQYCPFFALPMMNCASIRGCARGQISRLLRGLFTNAGFCIARPCGRWRRSQRAGRRFSITGAVRRILDCGWRPRRGCDAAGSIAGCDRTRFETRREHQGRSARVSADASRLDNVQGSGIRGGVRLRGTASHVEVSGRGSKSSHV